MVRPRGWQLPPLHTPRHTPLHTPRHTQHPRTHTPLGHTPVTLPPLGTPYHLTFRGRSYTLGFSWRVFRKPVTRFFSQGGTVEDTSMLHSTLHIHSRPLHVTHTSRSSLLSPLHPSHPLLSPCPLSPLLLPSPWSGCCSLVEMGTCAYCHWSWKRRRRGREDGAVANSVQLPAASSSNRGLLVG